jgi:hypothetical protein
VSKVVVFVGNPRVEATVALETGWIPGDRACSQKPRQCLLRPTPPVAVPSWSLERFLYHAKSTVKVVPASTHNFEMVPVEPTVVSDKPGYIARDGRPAFNVDDVVHKWRPNQGDPLPNFRHLMFGHPDRDRQWDEDGVRIVRGDPLKGASVVVYDLGSIGSYHVEVMTGAGCAIVVPGEVCDEDGMLGMRTGNRAKTALGFAVDKNCRGRFHGLLGGRFLWVFQTTGLAPEQCARVFAVRMEYPLRLRPWGSLVLNEPVELPSAGAIFDAVVNTMKACVQPDGVVDTPFRESTVWVQDCIEVLRAMRLVCTVDCAAYIRQMLAMIANTYRDLDVTIVGSGKDAKGAQSSWVVVDSKGPKKPTTKFAGAGAGAGAGAAGSGSGSASAAGKRARGMTTAIVPTPTHTELFIPGYHLQFCIAVKEFPTDCIPRVAEKVARHSMDLWREMYLERPGTGLLVVPGPDTDSKMWHFVDWARHAHNRHDREHSDEHPMNCNAALNALWKLACDAWGVPHGLDVATFRAHFELPDGSFRMTAADTEPSVHATTYAILADLCSDVGASGMALMVQLADWGASSVPLSDLEHGGPTLYFSAYVADALKRAGFGAEASRHVEEAFGHWAHKLGTLIEKKLPTSSLAHAWSVGAIRHVLDLSVV